MKKLDLVSKDWCNLIFQDKNKDYGAYMMRLRSGRRHQFALLCVAGSILLLTALALGLRYFVIYELRKSLHELEQFGQIDLPKAREGYEEKTVSAGRHVRHINTAVVHPDARPDVPEIVNLAPRPYRFGEKGEEKERASELEELLPPPDTSALENDPLAPQAGMELTPTEIVEQMPQFPGGPKALMRWLDAHIPYPSDCIKAGVEGTLEVTFIVTPDGKVKEPAVSKKLHPKLDALAIGALRRMPRWRPGQQNGRPVTVKVTIPVVFALK